MCKLDESKDIRDFDSFYELIEYFNTEERCVDYLADLRWNGEPQCPYCGHTESYEMNVKGRGKRWKCKDCKKQYSVKVGTVFENSPISLRKWFIAIYLITSHKKGISSHQLAKDIKITQKSAWFVLHRIRTTFAPKEDVKLGLNKVVEIDETFIGGKFSNRHKSKRTKEHRRSDPKVPVLGMIERGGKVYSKPIRKVNTPNLMLEINKKVEFGSTIYTDSFPSYENLTKNYTHASVKHSLDEYVRGPVHTNSIESYWAIVKRTIFGIYHHTSPTHLPKYLNECGFRLNNRNLSEGTRFDVVLANSQGRLTYNELINERYKNTQAGPKQA